MTVVATDRGTANGAATDAVTAFDSVTTLAPADGSLIVACVAGQRGDNTALSYTMTDTFADSGGGAWTAAGTGTINAGGETFRASIFVRQIGTGAGSSKKVTATRTAGNIFWQTFINVLEVTGHNTSSPVGLSAGNGNSGASTTVDLGSAPVSTSLVVSCGFANATGTLTIPTSGYTTIYNAVVSGAGFAVVDKLAGSQTLVWTCDSVHIAAAAGEILIAAAAVGQPTAKRYMNVPFARSGLGGQARIGG